MTDRWFDDAAGPVVRPYAMTRGRTRGSVGADQLDLIALVIAEGPPEGGPTGADGTAAARREGGAPPAGARGGGPQADGPRGDDLDDDHSLAPEHVDIVLFCRRAPQSVAELAAELDLPVGVVRVLVGDLIDAELVRVTRPVPPADLPDEHVLREVIDGLRAL